MFVRGLFAVMLSACLMGCQGAASMDISGQHPKDKIRWLSSGEEPHLHITCSEGIGHLVMSSTQPWPSSALVSLPLDALEGFVLRADTQLHRLEVMSDGQPIIEPNMNSALSLVSVEEVSSGLEFTLRIDFDRLNTPDRKVLLSWVDYYR